MSSEEARSNLNAHSEGIYGQLASANRCSGNLVRQYAGCKPFTPRRQYRKNPHLRSTLRMPVRVLWRVLANHFRLDRATAVGRGVKNRLDGHKFAKLPHKTTVFVRTACRLSPHCFSCLRALSAGLGRFDVAAATGIFPLLPVSVGCSKKRPIFGPLRALVPLRVACCLGLQPEYQCPLVRKRVGSIIGKELEYGTMSTIIKAEVPIVPERIYCSPISLPSSSPQAVPDPTCGSSQRPS